MHESVPGQAQGHRKSWPAIPSDDYAGCEPLAQREAERFLSDQRLRNRPKEVSAMETLSVSTFKVPSACRAV